MQGKTLSVVMHCGQGLYFLVEEIALYERQYTWRRLPDPLKCWKMYKVKRLAFREVFTLL